DAGIVKFFEHLPTGAGLFFQHSPELRRFFEGPESAAHDLVFKPGSWVSGYWGHFFFLLSLELLLQCPNCQRDDDEPGQCARERRHRLLVRLGGRLRWLRRLRWLWRPRLDRVLEANRRLILVLRLGSQIDRKRDNEAEGSDEKEPAPAPLDRLLRPHDATSERSAGASRGEPTPIRY